MTRPSPTDRLPDPGAGFVWDTFPGAAGPAPVLRPEAAGVAAAFTTRVGGVSTGPYASLNVARSSDDDQAAVARNRVLAGRAIGITEPWCPIEQVHAATVVRASDTSTQADGQWTTERGRALSVVAADCVPVLAVAAGKVGVAHAGWRGTLAGVVDAIIGAVEPSVLFAGPAIGPCCYEVGTDLASRFADRFGPHVAPGGDHLDLWACVAAIGRAAGVETVAARLCTGCHAELFYSHRRDGVPTGRQALIAALDA